MFPWKTTISLDREIKRPLYLQISDNFVRQITSGHVQPGMKIPGTRAMAALLEVNRKTILQAYEELLAQGWLEIRPSSGTFISQHLPLTKQLPLQNQEQQAEEAIPEFRHYDFIESYHPFPKQIIKVDGGSPDARLAPTDWIYKECRSFTNLRNGYKLLQYDDARGNLYLRNVLSKYLSESRGMQLSEQDILLTRGSQMGIFIAASTLIKSGDSVIIGDSSYDAADWALQFHGAKLIRVKVDAEGLCIDKLESICIKQNIKLVYITPHHHFPTTVTLSSARRVKLLTLAKKYNFYILEDDYDFDFHYKSAPLLPLASLNHHQRVIYIGSFSKIFAASIRIGYLVAPKAIVEELSKVSRIIDRQGDHVMQRVMAEAIETGELNRHLKKSLKVYRERRDFLVKELKSKLGDHIVFKVPEGGMAIWIVFKNLSLLELQPLFENERLYLDIEYQLAKAFNGFRFGFASLSKNEIENVVRIMATVIKRLSS